MKALSLLALSLMVLPGIAAADVITLKDGSKIEGEIKRAGDNYTVRDAAGQVTNVPVEKVSSIDVHPQSGGDVAMGRLQSLRRAADNMGDLRQIIDRYRAFIEQNPNTPAGAAADKDLKNWIDRQDQGLVKVGDKWMTLTDRDSLRAKSTDVAIGLHDMIKQGRLKEATAALDRALQVDPQNISFHYLHGVIQYQEEMLPPARKSFETVSAAAPDHAPTLNNLAVILWRQNARVIALGYYDRALLAAPGSRDILDNIAESLNGLPPEQRSSVVVKKLLRHFKEQDDALQKKMAANGQFRWGSTWVSEKELKKLQDAEKAVKDQLAQMELDFASVQKRIGLIDRQIAEVVNEMNLIDAQTYATGPNGQVVRLPYPPLYFTLQQQAGTLRAERETRVGELDRLRKGAKQVQGQMPLPRYTGIQKLIDADGMPLPAGARLPAAPMPAPVPIPIPAPTTAPAAPATQPAGATQPAVGNVRVPL